jgi:tetratricopeptide (TPR) repeat protein
MARSAVKSLAALKGHPEKDAVRIWLLSRAAHGLWDYYRQAGSSTQRSTVNGQVVSIMNEVEELEKSGAGKKNLKELGEVLKKTYRSSGDVQYAHGNIGWTRPPEVLLKHCMADGYFAAANSWNDLEDRAAAARAMRRCAYYYAETYRWRSEHVWRRYFDMYYGLLDDKARLEAAREDVIAGAKRFEDDKALYMAHPADWKCKECGRGREAHVADRAKEFARFVVRLARALAANGLYEQSAGKYRQALKLDPVDGGYVSRRKTLRTGRAGLGASRIEAEHPPRAPMMIMELADALEKAGQLEEALGLLKKLVSKPPASAALVGKLAGFYERAGRKPAAIAAWKQYIELLPGETRGDRARKARAEHRIAVLEGRFEGGLKTDLSDPATRKLHQELNAEISKMLLDRRYEAGLALLRSDALRHFPQDRGFLRREMEFLRRMGRREELAAKQAAFARLFPDHAAWMRKVRGQSAQPRTGGGSQEYSAFMKEVMALSMGRNADYEKALKVLREGVGRFPDRKVSLARREVKILARAKRHDERVKLAREYAGKYPDDRCEFMSEEIESLIATGSKAQARKRLQEFEAAVAKVSGRRTWYYRRKIERLKRQLNGGGGGPALGGRGGRGVRRR